MITTEVSSGFREFQKSLEAYLVASGRTPSEVLAHQGEKLRFALYRAMRAEMPERGSIRASLMGGALRVRPRIRERAKTRKQAYARELSARERARGYLAYSFLFPSWRKAGPAARLKAVESGHTERHFAATRGLVGTLESGGRPADRYLRIVSTAAEVGAISDQRGVTAAALSEVRKDIEAYTARKQDEKSKALFQGTYGARK